jgi:hypothetical protein
MTSKRVALFLGVASLVAIAISGLVTRPIDAGHVVPRQFSDRAWSIIGTDPEARVPPQDLQCNVKVGWGLAQCGSQASSCKNCHEVKGEDPVNAKGDWHISHAFGDFCEFCHGGNVQATDKAAAHEGLVKPLGDVQTNCSACHADDLQARAEKYATALGVTVGTGGNDTSTGGTSGSGASSDSAANQPETNPSKPSEPDQSTASQPVALQPALAATPTSNEIVDYVARFQATEPAPPSVGTAVVSWLLAATVVGGGVFVFWNEMRLRSKRRETASVVATTVTDERSQELAELLPLLDKLEAQALRGLRAVLSNRR